MQIKCPMCSKVLEAAQDHPPRPFCSARCKLADLDNWLTERYRVAGVGGDSLDGYGSPAPSDTKGSEA